MQQSSKLITVLAFVLIGLAMTNGSITKTITGACTTVSDTLKLCPITVTVNGELPESFDVDYVSDSTGLVYQPIVSPLFNFSMLAYSIAEYQFASSYSGVTFKTNGTCNLNYSSIPAIAWVGNNASNPLDNVSPTIGADSLAMFFRANCPVANWTTGGPDGYFAPTMLGPVGCQKAGIVNANGIGYCKYFEVNRSPSRYSRYTNIVDRIVPYVKLGFQVGTTTYSADTGINGCKTYPGGVKICYSSAPSVDDDLWFPDFFVNQANSTDVRTFSIDHWNAPSWNNKFYGECDWYEYYYGRCDRILANIIGAPATSYLQYVQSSLLDSFKYVKEFCNRLDFRCAAGPLSAGNVASTYVDWPIADVDNADQLSDYSTNVEFVPSPVDSRNYVLNLTNPTFGQMTFSFKDYVKVADVVASPVSATKNCALNKTNVNVQNQGNDGSVSVTLVKHDKSEDSFSLDVPNGLSLHPIPGVDYEKVCIDSACVTVPSVVCNVLSPPPKTEAAVPGPAEPIVLKSAPFIDPHNKIQFTFQMITLGLVGLIAVAVAVMVVQKYRNRASASYGRIKRTS